MFRGKLDQLIPVVREKFRDATKSAPAPFAREQRNAQENAAGWVETFDLTPNRCHSNTIGMTAVATLAGAMPI